jgi:2-polyprenyl-3-methyl-5-hydroxy-6-metoxy-1,4-benzoquinol methylase
LQSTQHFDDPVAAYSRLAPHYAELSARREFYLRTIEEIILSRVSKSAKSLLDVGAGDGARASRIAEQSGIQNVVLAEPSPEMVAPVAATKVWNVRAEEMGDQVRSKENGDLGTFDVITCLWNVLGHVRGFEKRGRAMRAMNNLLSPEGKCFIDVNHRYNARAYGALPTLARLVRDSISYAEENADVTATWEVCEEVISTYGHVFTDREIRQLAGAAGLEIEERIVVDYDSGKIRRFGFAGSLLYVLRRTSMRDSASPPHTS